MPAARAKVPSAKSTLGSGRDLCLASAIIASATASCRDLGAARRSRSISRRPRGSAPRYTACPKPGMRSPRRSESPTTRGASAASRAADSSVSTASEAPPCSVPLTAPSPADTTAYGSARADAAVRAASVDAASSWSASNTSEADITPAIGRDRRRSHSLVHSRPATDAGSAGGVLRGGRQSTMPAMIDRPAAITAGRSRCSRSGSTTAIAGTSTCIRSSGSRSAGSASWTPRPAVSAASGARHAGAPGSPNAPVHSSSATSSNVRARASPIASCPR